MCAYSSTTFECCNVRAYASSGRSTYQTSSLVLQLKLRRLFRLPHLPPTPPGSPPGPPFSVAVSGASPHHISIDPRSENSRVHAEETGRDRSWSTVVLLLYCVLTVPLFPSKSSIVNRAYRKDRRRLSECIHPVSTCSTILHHR